MRTKLLSATALLVGLLAASAAPAPAPALGDKVVAFCKKEMGEQVGGGECAHLASAALKSVGIDHRGAKDSPNAGDYVWGELVYVLDKDPKGATHGKVTDIKPGDIIQYRDTKWAGPKRGGKGTYSASAAHHTSVVAAVEDKGKTIKIYQQNSGGKRFVTEGVLYLDDLKEGWIRVYRPVTK
jgi:hypothetical protein